jgi:hypothetical protein
MLGVLICNILLQASENKTLERRERERERESKEYWEFRNET